MAPKSTEQAAGGLVWRQAADGLEVLLAHRPRYDDWAFPKGKLDDGECLLECALREVLEETGLNCRAGRYAGMTEFTLPSGRRKTVSYWAMEVIDGSFEPNAEVDEIAWVAIDDLADELSYELDLLHIQALDADWYAAPDRILLTRHAHAGDRFRWNGNDEERPLSPQGYREAAQLPEALSGFHIDRAFSSRALRCTETIEPITQHRGLTLEIHPDLWEATPYEQIQRLLDDVATGTTLLSSHGPVVANALHALTGESVGIPMEKGSTWVLDFTGGELVAANYMAPPPSD